MDMKEKVNVINCNIDKETGKILSHEEIYSRIINLLGGLDVIRPLIPFSKDEIKKAIKTDKHLNNLPLAKWDAASGFRCEGSNVYIIGSPLWNLYAKAGIKNASCYEGVCILKEAARQIAAE